MSHFVGAVVIPAGTKIDLAVTERLNWYPAVKANRELDEVLSLILAPFNENLAVEPYIDADDPQESLARAREYYGANDPSYLEGKTDLEILNVDWSEGYVEENGKIVKYSTYNPQSKWDWYHVGGRWEERYRDRQGESITALRQQAQDNLLAVEVASETEKDWMGNPITELVLNGQSVDYLPYTVIVPNEDGTTSWLSQGDMGWFGISSGDDTEQGWANTILKATEHLTDGAVVVFVDFHI